MAKISFKSLNIIQRFCVDSLDVCTRVWGALKDADDAIYVSWQTNIDDPTDLTFVVGAMHEDALRDFIIKHADTLAELSGRAAALINTYYLYEGRNFAVIAAPKGATPVDYKTYSEVCKGPERNSSWWYDCAHQEVVTKRDVIDNEPKFTSHKFVKVRD